MDGIQDLKYRYIQKNFFERPVNVIRCDHLPESDTVVVVVVVVAFAVAVVVVVVAVEAYNESIVFDA